MARKRTSLGWKSFLLVLALALVLGPVYRFTELQKRPMHTDEAILAIKSQDLLRTGFFQYDPTDYHGPLLHYATRVISWVAGWDADDLTEERVRHVTAIFGVGLMLLPLLMSDGLGRTGTSVAVLFLAVSPMMAYYSRYYIMEMPFAFLLGLFVASLWRYSRSRNFLWLIIAGVCLGWMHAAKETFVINVAAMVLAWGLAQFIAGSGVSAWNTKPQFRLWNRIKGGLGWWPWMVVIGISLLASIWLYSNSFKDSKGVVDSALTYLHYLERSGGSGHEKPWNYYLDLFFYTKDTFVWTEALIGGFAILGMISVLADRDRPRSRRIFQGWLAFSLILGFIFYSLIPYKTPWSVLALGFLMAMLGGVGVSVFFRFLGHPALKTAGAVLIGAGIYHLCYQTSLVTDYAFPYQNRIASDPRNPYVYSHTSPSLVRLSEMVHKVTRVHPDGKNMLVEVIQSELGWPLPWYLRDMPKASYMRDIPAFLHAPIVVVDADKGPQVQAMLTAQALKALEPPPEPEKPLPFVFPHKEVPPMVLDVPFGAPPAIVEKPKPVTYETSYYGLRPGILLLVFVRTDLWEDYLKLPEDSASYPVP